MTARLPIIGMEKIMYVSFFPGEKDTIRVILPGGGHLRERVFSVAVHKAQRGETTDRGRIRIVPENTQDGLALRVCMDSWCDPKEEEIFLNEDVVEEVIAAIDLARVIQGHYARFEYDEVEDDSEGHPMLMPLFRGDRHFGDSDAFGQEQPTTPKDAVLVPAGDVFDPGTTRSPQQDGVLMSDVDLESETRIDRDVQADADPGENSGDEIVIEVEDDD